MNHTFLDRQKASETQYHINLVLPDHSLEKNVESRALSKFHTEPVGSSSCLQIEQADVRTGYWLIGLCFSLNGRAAIFKISLFQSKFAPQDIDLSMPE